MCLVHSDDSGQCLELGRECRNGQNSFGRTSGGPGDSFNVRNKGVGEIES